MTLALTGPLAFSLHPGSWAAVLAATAGYALVIRSARYRVPRRQAWSFVGAMAVLVVALTWPLADLAAHRLLVALVVQRLLLMLAFPPLLVAGLPPALVAAATRPPLVDAVARRCTRPILAIAIVTVIAIGTLTVPAVQAQTSSAWTRGGLDLLLICAGLVLWMPVLHPLPGTEHMSSLGQAGYLVVQSILPSFLSIVWIFARHPLYPAYAHGRAVLGLSPLVDQEVSGFVAKLGTIFVLWTVAFVIVSRSEQVAGAGGDPDPLTWADVERQLERVARRERRGATRPEEPRPGSLGERDRREDRGGDGCR
jgi:cytochrome c oxidase assembly factor CtaG